MKSRQREDDLGLSAEDLERVKAAAAAALVPGLEGLAERSAGGVREQAPDPSSSPGPIRSSDPLPGKKHARGRRMI